MYDDWKLYGFPREAGYEEVFQDPSLNHVASSASASLLENGITEISAQMNSPRLELEDEGGIANIDLNSFQVIMKHFQNLRKQTDNTNAIIESQIPGLTSEINHNGFAIQDLDEVANSYQLSCVALTDTIKKVHDFLAVGSQPDDEAEGGSDSGFESVSPPASETPCPAASSSTPSPAQSHQTTLETCEQLETRSKDLQAKLARITTLPNQQHTDQLQIVAALRNHLAQMSSDVYKLTGEVLQKVEEWQTSRERLLTELDKIEVLYRKTFAINEACRKQISELMIYLRHQLHYEEMPAFVVGLQNKFMRISRDLIAKFLVIEELPNRVLGLKNNLKIKVRPLLQIDFSNLTANLKKSAISASSLKAVVVTDEEMKRLNEATKNCSLVQVQPPTYVKVGSPATEDGRNSSKKRKRFAIRKKARKADSGHTSFVNLLIHGQNGVNGVNEVCVEHSVELAYPEDMAPIEVTWVSGTNLTATFEKSKLGKQLKREKSDDDESVVHEKFHIIFCTKVLDGYQTEMWVWTATPKSCRIVTNSSQIADAVEDVIWSDTCDISEPDGSVPHQYHRETLPAANLRLVLREWLRHETKVEPSRRQMKFLMRKLLSCSTVLGQNVAPTVIPHGHITRDQFSKTQLPKKDSTFWESLFETSKFINDHLSIGQTGPYQDGKISFASREDVEEELKDAPKGAFIPRFSDIIYKEKQSQNIKTKKLKTEKIQDKPKEPKDIVEKLGITISFVDGENQVQHWGPLSARVLSTKSLAMHISQNKDLRHLYPEGIPKEAHDGFGKYIVPDEPPKGYAKVLAFFEGLKLKDSAKSSGPVSGNSKASAPVLKRGSRNQQEPSSTSTCGFEPSAFAFQQLSPSQTVPATSNGRLPPISSIFHRPGASSFTASPIPFTLQGHFPGPSLNPIADIVLPYTNSPMDAGDIAYYRQSQSNTMNDSTNGMDAAAMNDFMRMDFQESLALPEFDSLIAETEARSRSTETEVQGRNLADGHMAYPQWNYPSQMNYDGMGHDIIAQPK